VNKIEIIIPMNPIKALADGNMLQIIACAVIIAASENELNRNTDINHTVSA
jgi:Na+/H+-dicarboxylate symporter